MNKKYGSSKPVNYISNIKSAQNGNYILCGYSMLDAYLPIAGWLMEVNSEGDSLWYRDYFYYPQNPDYSHNYLYDISLAEDNGFVSVGQAFTLSPPNNVQKMWVIKVDSVGCEIPNCWVGIEENDGKEAWEHGGMEIFPNPASVEIYVRLNMDDGRFNMDLKLEIFDIFGRSAPANSLPRLGEGWGGGKAGPGGGRRWPGEKRLAG